MPNHFDAVFVADPRFPGGTSTALAAEMQAATKARMSHALVPIKSSVLRRCWPFHPEIAEQLQEGTTVLVEPDQEVVARFAVIHHPMIFQEPPASYLGIQAKHVVLVLHHPPMDGLGKVEYGLEQIVEHVRAAFGQVPLLAPVGPKVRAQLPKAGVAGAPLLDRDWHNIIDVRRWPARQPDLLHSPIHVGRTSRPHPPKWPDSREEAMKAWPKRPDLHVSMLGGGDFLTRVYDPVPGHWDLRPFQSQDVKAYLSELDFFVYFHSAKWVEAFGRSILEALASGLVCILPASFEPLFGPAAVYAEPGDVSQIIDEFTADPRRYQMQSRRARSYVEKTFGLDTFPERLAAIDPEWSPLGTATNGPESQARPKTVLFVSSNGVGLGHLTRQLAIADASPPDIQPVFFTLSQGMRLAAEAGYPVEYRPFHRSSKANVQSWNDAISQELAQAISFYGAETLVFDGNMPYGGLITAIEQFPNLKSIWIRRGFWADLHAEALERATHFDAVIEPRDLAAAFDHGPTRSARDSAFETPPIVRTAGMRQDKAASRRALGLDPDKIVGALSLGSGSNFDLGEVRRSVIDCLASKTDVELVEVVSPIAADSPPPANGVRQIERYPLFPLLNGFDFIISTCGYNTFHEVILSGLPAIFVPNEAEEMDLQLRRAKFGEIAGANLLIRASMLHHVPRVLARILEEDCRARLRARATGLWATNGAGVAAGFIRDYTYLRKTMRDFAPPNA